MRRTSDPWLRVVAVMGLARIGSPGALVAIQRATAPVEPASSWWKPPKPDPAVVAALRRLQDPRALRNDLSRPAEFDDWWQESEFLDGCWFEDSDGVEWVMFPRVTLGCQSDLWISHRGEGEEWSPGEFIGQLAPEPPRPCDSPELRRLCELRDGQLLIGDAGGWWDSHFLSSLRLDRDGDGLTDLVEERIQTDPERVDTDWDGLPDPDDPAPNARADAPSREGDAALLALIRQTRFGDNPPPYRSEVLFVVSKSAPEWRRRGGATISYTRNENEKDPPAWDFDRLTIVPLAEIDGDDWLSSLSSALPRSLLGNSESVFILFYSGHGSEVTMREMGGDWYLVAGWDF